MKSLKYRIDRNDFARMFDFSMKKAPDCFFERLKHTDTRWREPSANEIESYVLMVLTDIEKKGRPRTVGENRTAFEVGWTENLEKALMSRRIADALKPGYFRDIKYLRYNHTLIVSDNLQLEHDLFVLARMLIFQKYLAGIRKIYEFGCGSCSNLLLLSEMFPSAQLMGLDWTVSSARIADMLSAKMRKNIRGGLFDFLEPDSTMRIEPGSAVLTIHALEQVGNNHKKWIEFLLRNRPEIVVNYEPILEFYDETNLYDYLALSYCRKRGYLLNYLTELKRLEKKNKVKILCAHRPALGGVIHESSLVVWRPI